MAAKTRPVLVVSIDYGDEDRAIVTVVPHTTDVRGGQFEVAVTASFLRPGAFSVQGISTYPRAWAVRRLGTLSPSQFEMVAARLSQWLGLRA